MRKNQNEDVYLLKSFLLVHEEYYTDVSLSAVERRRQRRLLYKKKTQIEIV